MNLFTFLNDQLLKMNWLSELVRILVEGVFRLPMDTWQGGSLHFFLYDTIKIFILLTILIFSISYVQSYFPPERTRALLTKVGGVWANILAALLGTITPFCSCSSIPLFIGFTNAGLPIGVTFSFLISSPLVDLASILLLASIFNWKIALAYVLVGLVLAVVGGSLISLAKLERFVEPSILGGHKIMNQPQQEISRKERIDFSKEQVLSIIRKVWLYILIGVGIGSLIHNIIPESFITTVLGNDNPFSVILVTLLGIPMYADIFGTLPIAEALVYKGVGIGTVLSFMMAVTALSLPSLIMLNRVVKKQLLVVFTLIVTTGIILIGYLFNALGSLLI